MNRLHPYRRLLTYLRPHRTAIALTWVISILVLALQGLTAWLGAAFIETVLHGGSSPVPMLAGVGRLARFLADAANLLLDRGTPFRSLVVAVSVLVGTGLFTMGLRVWKTALFARLNQAVLRQIRVQMFEHLTRLDLSFTKQHRPGEIASLFTRDVDALRAAIVDLCDRIFMQPLRLLMALAMLWSLSPGLALVFAVSLLVCGGLAHAVGRRVTRLSHLLMQRITSLQGFLTEYLTTVLLARSLGRETRERQRCDQLCRELAKADIELTVTESLAPQLINNLFVAAGALVLLLGSYLVLVSHRTEPGVLLRFVLCLPLAAYPVESLALLYVSVRRATASAVRVFAFLDEPAAAADAPGAVEPPENVAQIKFDQVSFHPSGHPVLTDLSFSLKAGERLSIRGPSGAGKTTVLHLLAGVLRPDSGRILVNGLDLAGFRGESWRRRIGLVPQESIMMNGTVRDNLRFASETADDPQMICVLQQVLFADDEPACRLVLDRPVGNRGELLSGGERQRLAIARALLTNPFLLLLDEPTAQLDAANRMRVRETLLALPRTVTLIFTSHDHTLHDLADSSVELADGTLVTPQPA